MQSLFFGKGNDFVFGENNVRGLKANVSVFSGVLASVKRLFQNDQEDLKLRSRKAVGSVVSLRNTSSASGETPMSATGIILDLYRLSLWM